MEKLLEWKENFERVGGKIDGVSDDLQRFINNPKDMEWLLRCMRARSVQRNGEIIVPKVLPESHRMAKGIMGPNFIGLEAAQYCAGGYEPDELADRWEIPYTQDTLIDCVETHSLVCMHQMNFCELYQRHQKKNYFYLGQDLSWFTSKVSQAQWSGKKNSPKILLVRNIPLQITLSADMEEQNQLFAPTNEFILNTAEFTDAAIKLHSASQGKLRLGGWGISIRFPPKIPTLGGTYVRASWHEHQLQFIRGSGRAEHGVAVLTARRPDF